MTLTSLCTTINCKDRTQPHCRSHGISDKCCDMSKNSEPKNKTEVLPFESTSRHKTKAVVRTQPHKLCVGDTVKQSDTRKRANCWPQMPLPTARRAARGLHGKNTDYRLLHYRLMHMRIYRLRPRQRHTPNQCRSSVLALHFLITGNNLTLDRICV